MVMLYLFLFLAIALEAFPISSSGHMLLFADVLNALGGYTIDHELFSILDHLSHLMIAAGIALYFFKRSLVYVKKFWSALGIITKIFLLGCIADGMTVAMYCLVHVYGCLPIGLPVGFFVTGCLLYSLRYVPAGHRSWDARSAFLIGCAQSLALIPGISRFGSTYVAARWCGIRPQRAFEISFLLEFPISIAGGLLGLLLMRQHNLFPIILNSTFLLVMLSAVAFFMAGLYGIERIIRADRLWVLSGYLMVMVVVSSFLMIKGII